MAEPHGVDDNAVQVMPQPAITACLLPPLPTAMSLSDAAAHSTALPVADDSRATSLGTSFSRNVKAAQRLVFDARQDGLSLLPL